MEKLLIGNSSSLNKEQKLLLNPLEVFKLSTFQLIFINLNFFFLTYEL